MALFEYEYHNTPVHDLHPLAKLAIMGTFSTLVGYVQDPRFKIPLIIAVAALCVLAKLPFKQYGKLLVFVVFSTLLASAHSILFLVDSALFHVYPQEWVATTIVEVLPEGFPVFGRAALTYGGLLYWVTIPLTAVCVVLAVSFYIYTTPLVDTLQMLHQLHAPFPVIYVVSVALRFVPELVDKMTTVRTAQQLRGWSGKTRNPIKAVSLYAPLLVPIVRHIVKATDTMTMSATNRGFGLHKVASLREMELTARDRMIVIACVTVFAAGMFAVFYFKVGRI